MEILVKLLDGKPFRKFVKRINIFAILSKLKLYFYKKNICPSFPKSVLLIGFLTTFFSVHSFAKEIHVGATNQYKNIQTAINAANSGDIIKVKSGIYFEHKIIINKTLSLIGENNPVIDAQEKDDGININANDVKIIGFIIKNTATGSINDFAGIRVFRANNVVVLNNTLRNTFFGIVFQDSKNGLIENNKVIGENLNQTKSGNGIQLWQCKNIAIKNNYITKHRDGIYFEFARFCHIENNLSEQNFRYGLHFMFSDNDWYYHNIFRNNGTGAAIMYSKHIEMLYNTFQNNWGDASYALLLKDISDGIIIGNRFTKNTIGALLDGSNRIKVTRNLFESNGWAVKLMANCSKQYY